MNVICVWHNAKQDECEMEVYLCLGRLYECMYVCVIDIFLWCRCGVSWCWVWRHVNGILCCLSFHVYASSVFCAFWVRCVLEVSKCSARDPRASRTPAGWEQICAVEVRMVAVSGELIDHCTSFVFIVMLRVLLNFAIPCVAWNTVRTAVWNSCFVKVGDPCFSCCGDPQQLYYNVRCCITTWKVLKNTVHTVSCRCECEVEIQMCTKHDSHGAMM